MRDIIVVDCETTGLSDWSKILEIAAVNLSTGEEFYLAPYVDQSELAGAEPKALQINRYYERGVFESMKSGEDNRRWYQSLWKMLNGNTFAGSNPTFDSQLIGKVVQKSWHHRLLDLSAYACGIMGWPPNDLLGLEKVCQELGVENTEPHSALGDARATAECFRKLMDFSVENTSR